MGFLQSIVKVFKLIYEEGEKEWMDETKYREQLNNLNIQLENEEITEEEFEEAESIIIEHLKQIREYKKEHGYIK